MSTRQPDRHIVEKYPNGNIAVTMISTGVVRYDVYRVGQRGWGTSVPINQHSLRLRQYTAREQDRIARGD